MPLRDFVIEVNVTVRRIYRIEAKSPSEALGMVDELEPDEVEERGRTLQVSEDLG